MQSRGGTRPSYLEPVVPAPPAPHDELIQELWGGCGRLLRRRDRDGTRIVKEIRWPAGRDRSQARKRRSYQVEAAWYARWAERVPQGCRIPSCLGLEENPGLLVLTLEDLDAAGFPRRATRPTGADLEAAVAWLARFHAAFLGVRPDGLWKEGSYWHLATRPDELATMPRGPLREAAADLDRRLTRARFRTLVHGDAKPDNFCFGAPGRVSAVDFQYVGGGCGMRDLAYLLDCVFDRLDGPEAGRTIESYFATLRRALPPDVPAEAIEAEWRALLPVAWLDFQRFLQGWHPAYARPAAPLAQRIESALASIS